MKVPAIAASILILLSTSWSQIPNAGFENWTLGAPDSWVVNNIPGFYTTVTQSGTSHSGASALRAAPASFSGNIMPPYVWGFFPVSVRYARFTGWHRYTSVAGDIMYIEAVMVQGGNPIGAGGIEKTATTTTYTQFTADITYFAPGNPDSVYLFLFIDDSAASGTPNLGSFFLLDDVGLSGVSSADDGGELPGETRLHQNYPNPFNPVTTIEYEISQSDLVQIRVYDLLGREVATLVNENQTPGRRAVQLRSDGLPSGTYFYQLVAGRHRQTKALMIVR